jgi:hypothetical protein
MTTETKIVLFAIDIETDGPSATKHSILSIGICVGDLDGRIIEKRRFDMKPAPGRHAEESTMTGFWGQRMDTLKALQQNAEDVQLALTAFANTLDKADSDYDLRILSDNVGFDIAFINNYFETFLNRLPLQYRLGKRDEYRPVFDTDCFNRGIIQQTHENAWTFDSTVMKQLNIDPASVCDANHFPEEDAAHIYQLHVQILKILQSLKPIVHKFQTNKKQ